MSRAAWNAVLSKNRSRNHAAKKKKKKARLKIYLSFSFLSFLSFFFLFFFLEEKLSRKSARANQCDQMLRGTWNFHHALFLSFSIEKYIIYIYIFFITINFLFLDILSSRKMKRKWKLKRTERKKRDGNRFFLLISTAWQIFRFFSLLRDKNDGTKRTYFLFFFFLLLSFYYCKVPEKWARPTSFANCIAVETFIALPLALIIHLLAS